MKVKDIKIDPIPNYKIAPEAFNQVKSGASQSNNRKIPDNDVLVMTNVFKNGQKRVNLWITEKKNGKTFMSVFPNPVQLYFSFAIKAFNQSEGLINKEFIKTSKKINNEEKYMLDVSSDQTHPIYNTYLQLKVSSIIMLVCAIESFINSIIPELMSYTSERGDLMNQDGIQRKLTLDEKISKVVPLIYGIDFKTSHSKEFGRIKSLNRLRNDFVHLKNFDKSPLSVEQQKLFLSLIKFNIKSGFEAAKIYMNTHKPDFVIENND